jgi:hypothetical protein
VLIDNSLYQCFITSKIVREMVHVINYAIDVIGNGIDSTEPNEFLMC